MKSKASSDTVSYDKGKAERPIVRSTRGVVATGHLLASLAGLDILRRGGNAVDAGVAAGICLNTVHHDMTTFSGVAPIILYEASKGSVTSISGLGRWPKRASLEYFWEEQDGCFTHGIKHCVMPAAADAWTTVLANYGTLTLAEVMDAAIGYAQEGFPVHDFMAYNFQRGWDYIRSWPSSAALAAPDGSILAPGDILRQPNLARTFQAMVDAERTASGERKDRIRAARDYFYHGDVARAFVDFSKQHNGFFTMEDFHDFNVQEEPVYSITYHGYEVLTCGPWCQGPVLLQALAILKNFSLTSMEHNSAEYLHTVISALDLAFADREFYYGDPEFVNVPMTELLSERYNSARAGLIEPKKAFQELPPPGDPMNGQATRRDYRWPPPGDWESVRHDVIKEAPLEFDTSYVCVIDEAGNMFSATPSDTFTTTLSGPIVPDIGLPFSARGKQSRLNPAHPSVIAAWKRPRLTPSPALVLKDGKPFMTIGTPGGDTQPQAMLQVLLNILDFKMDLQNAVEAPRGATYNYPGSFYPHQYRPGLMKLEGRIRPEVAEKLVAWGHTVESWPAKTWQAGSVFVATAPTTNGVHQAAADHRREGVALGW